MARRPRPPRRPDPAALETDDVRVATVLTVLWVIAFLVLLPFAGRLSDDGHLWWLEMCGAGIAIGIFGITYCRRRRAAIARDRGVDRSP